MIQIAEITLKIECENCVVEEFVVEERMNARNNRTVRELLKPAIEAGWHVGMRTLCPTCKDLVKNKCKTCVYYQNKSMCNPICLDSGAIVSGDDFCDNYIKVSNYFLGGLI